MMPKLAAFLDAIATKGGSILILFCCVALSGVWVIRLLHNPADDTVISTTILNVFSGFTGALINQLASKTAADQKLQTTIAANGANDVTKP